jgi:hypothetical protein
MGVGEATAIGTDGDANMRSVGRAEVRGAEVDNECFETVELLPHMM